ncbi:MAG: hypothetical protein LBJ21_09485 [Acidobacteriota bacterium]|jgi:hypothetical protein|nr:hypothetical protein [Acidobacteriota bacterium]
MKLFSRAMMFVFSLSIAATLFAGEITIYGGAQKPGELSWANASPVEAATDFAGDFGGTFGVRFSAGRVIGFEQGIGFSPRFAKPGVKAFQTDTNLLIQLPGNIVPYGTAGIGLVHTWGKDVPTSLDPREIAAFVFSAGTNFAVNYGGGLKIRKLAGPLGINIDVRGYTLPGFKAKFENSDTKEGLSFVQTSAGLVFTW